MKRTALLIAITLAGCTRGALPATLVAGETEAVFDTVAGVTLTRRTFDFTNVGDAATDMLRVELSGDVGHFDVDWDGCSGIALAAHSSCQVVARLVAVSEGVYDGELHVFAKAPVSASVLLHGKVMPAILSLTAATAPTLDVVQGQTFTLGFVVSNEGGVATGPLHITGPGAPFNGRSANCDGVSLAGGKSCMITLTSTVALDAPLGGASSSLDVAAMPGGEVGATPGIFVHAGGVLVVENRDWGAIPTVQSIQKTIKVANPGPQTTDPLTTSISTSEINTSFLIVSDGCGGKSLGPGTSCDVTVAANLVDDKLHSAALHVKAPNVREGIGMLTATGVRAHWTVALSFAGTGNGRISWPGGGSVGSPGMTTFVIGNGTKSPPFTVVPDPPATFSGWSGTTPCSGTGVCAPFVGPDNGDVKLIATLTQ
jgi:hypothetical protein